MPQKEYIKNIDLFSYAQDGDPYELGTYKCSVETNSSRYILKTDPKSVTFDNCYCGFLDQDFHSISPRKFLGAQLFNVVNDIDELKRDAKFATWFFQLGKHDNKHVKFETSKGDFYIWISLTEPPKQSPDYGRAQVKSPLGFSNDKYSVSLRFRLN